jgi:hypothetical protein
MQRGALNCPDGDVFEAPVVAGEFDRDASQESRGDPTVVHVADFFDAVVAGVDGWLAPSQVHQFRDDVTLRLGCCSDPKVVNDQQRRRNDSGVPEMVRTEWDHCPAKILRFIFASLDQSDPRPESQPGRPAGVPSPVGRRRRGCLSPAWFSVNVNRPL